MVSGFMTGEGGGVPIISSIVQWMVCFSTSSFQK